VDALLRTPVLLDREKSHAGGGRKARTEENLGRGRKKLRRSTISATHFKVAWDETRLKFFGNQSERRGRGGFLHWEREGTPFLRNFGRPFIKRIGKIEEALKFAR